MGAEARRRIAVAVLVLAGCASAPSGASAAERGRVHAGTTSADDPIVLRLSRSGGRVARIAMQISAPCAGSGDRVALLIDAPTGIGVRRGGRFAAKQPLDAPLASGRIARGKLAVKGRVEGRTIEGAVTFRARLLDPAGTATDRCRQRFTFTARSGRGRAFGGTTSQRAPVAIRVRGDTVVDGATIRLVRTVRSFAIGWRAAWSDGRTAQVGETLAALPVREGRFARTWTHERPRDGGGRDVIAYSLDGVIRGAKLTGTFRARSTRFDAAGAVQATADTGAVTFTARSG